MAGVVVYFLVQAKNSKQTWNIQIRIRQEDVINNKFPMDSQLLKARRVTLSNGIRMYYLEKPILGKRLMPLLNYYTRPGVYDIGISADNRIFIFTGIDGIDEQRKLLKVGVRYPGIDQDFDELNNQYKDLNKRDKTTNLIDLIKAGSLAIFAICFLVAMIFGGKYWLDGKEVDAQKNQLDLEIAKQQLTAANVYAESANAMNLLIPKLEEMYGTRNLQAELQKLKDAQPTP